GLFDAMGGVLGGRQVVATGRLVPNGVVLGVSGGAGAAGGEDSFAAEFEGVFNAFDEGGEAWAEKGLAADVGVGKGDVEKLVYFVVVDAGDFAHLVPEGDGVGGAGL